MDAGMAGIRTPQNASEHAPRLGTKASSEATPKNVREVVGSIVKYPEPKVRCNQISQNSIEITSFRHVTTRTRARIVIANEIEISACT